MNKIKAILFAVVLSAGAIFSVPANALGTTPWATVAAIQDGWVVDRMLVFPNTPTLTNPDGCPLVTNGYIIKETDPVHKTSYDMLIAAKVNNRQVAFVLDGCFEGRPRIISVSLR
ncbi:MAG: hypothetical protein ABL933_04850 [Methyloglobulus sp.]|nr:hypothetical protein [Methyloglobulus sp.]